MLLHLQCCMNNRGKKKGIFFRQLNFWSCKYATLEQCCIQPSPTPFTEAFQWQRDFACVDHKSQGILEKGPHKSRPIGEPEEGIPWSIHPEVIEKRKDWIGVWFKETFKFVYLLVLQRVILSKCNFKVSNFLRRLWAEMLVQFFYFTVNVNRSKWISIRFYCLP